jgi:hypothetical protein
VADIRAGNVVIRPSTGARVAWTPIEPVADEYDAAKALSSRGYSCLGVIGNASHLRGSGGHTPWCTEGYGGKACKAGRVYAIDLHLPDPAGQFLEWLRFRLRQGYYGWVYYLNFSGHQITRVDGFKGTYYSGDQHLHLSGLAGHESDNSSILRDWDAHLTSAQLVATASTTKASPQEGQLSAQFEQRAGGQLDALYDAVVGGRGEAYTHSRMRTDHGYQIDELTRRIEGYVDQRLDAVEAKLDAIAATLAGGHPPAA